MNVLHKLLAGLAAALVLSQAATAAEVTLTVHHFLSPKAPAHTRFIEPWARQVEADSGGRIKVEIFPSMSMGGKPPELYRQVRDGAADVVWTLTGYTPGVFPRSEVFELPTVHIGSALATTRAIQDNFELIADDFRDIKPLVIHTHAGNAIHLRDKRVAGLADVAGLKLRTPSRTGAWMIEAWGAEPVGMPVPALPQALSKGAVDGALVPFEIVRPLKLQELTRYAVEGADGSRFGTSVFLFGMNKERYDSLPDDLKAVIDKNSGAALGEKVGALFDSVEGPGRDAEAAAGNEIIALDAAAKAQFDAAGAKVVERWIEDATSNGIDGARLVETARAAIAAN